MSNIFIFQNKSLFFIKIWDIKSLHLLYKIKKYYFNKLPKIPLAILLATLSAVFFITALQTVSINHFCFLFQNNNSCHKGIFFSSSIFCFSFSKISICSFSNLSKISSALSLSIFFS
jgi:hypothetical protein